MKLHVTLIFAIIMSLFMGCADSENENKIEAIEKEIVDNNGKEEENDNLDTKIQDKTVTPELVKTNFKKKYPGEDDPDWELDDQGNWEASFKIDGISYRADYNPDGSWIETENSIDKDDLPKVIKDIIKSQYKDMEISEIEKVDHNSKGIFYDVEFKQKGKNLDIEFNEKGEILNQ